MIRNAPYCKNFNGYKPCFPDHDCWTNGCKAENPIGTKILIVNLDAMGDVLMTTAQLHGIKRKFPVSTIYWVTMKIAAPLLQNNHLVDYVYPYDFESLSILQQIEFDYVYSCDKSQRSCAITNMVKAKNKLGFGMDPNGKIIPLNAGANYNFLLGMDNHLKFKINTRTGQDYLAETFDLEFKGDEYVFNFTPAEIEYTNTYMKENGLGASDEIIGFNTGCSNLFPNKKMTVEQHIFLIEKLLAFNRFKILLLGGPEDIERNKAIAAPFGDKVLNTPATNGVRMGACYENIPQLIITGDSFGMHLAIALKKYVIAWFGLSCWTEIEMYGRGIKLWPEGLECSPCWKKSCPYNLECIDMIDLNRIVSETVTFFDSVKQK
ncbi:MAG: glycosyltransferase family 9 protein [Ignavibacteriaceae bacterium]|nr:glycosyltransferase family 9 protein [Ignavibacteriaceae bacterium]